MKKYILALLFIISCKDPKPSPVVTVDAGVDVVEQEVPKICTNLFSADKFSIEYDCSWEKVENDSYDIVLIDKTTKTLLTVNTENFSSTQEHFVLSKIRTLRNANANVEDADQTDFDGEKFYFVQAGKDDIESWHFFGMKDKTGYSISCGGPNNTIARDSCQTVFSSIKLK